MDTDSYRLSPKIRAQRFKRFSNIVTHRDPETKESIAHIPGMSHNDFTRAGVTRAFSFAKVFDIGGMMVIPNMEEMNAQGKQLVVLGQSISVSPLFHQRARVRFPMMLRSRVIQIGNTSAAAEFVLTDSEFGDELIRSRRSFAMMSRITGKSVRFPDDIRLDFYSRLHEDKNQKVEILKGFPPKPEGSFQLPLLVRHSDTDSLYHSNQASYFTYCMDSATEGAKLGHFRLLKGDLLSYPIESMECLYKGESHPGDTLDVIVWEDEGIPQKLYCQIEKQGKVICMGSIKFRVGISAKL